MKWINSRSAFTRQSVFFIIMIYNLWLLVITITPSSSVDGLFSMRVETGFLDVGGVVCVLYIDAAGEQD